MKKLTRIKNDDEILLEEIRRRVHVIFGRFVKRLCLLSPLSHKGLGLRSTVNSSSAWRLENHSNFLVVLFIQAVFNHLKSIKCMIYPYRLIKMMYINLLNGKCIVFKSVDSSELDKYDESQIFFVQDTDDIEEIQRRRSIQKKVQFNPHYTQSCERKAQEAKKTKQTLVKKKHTKK